MAQVLFLTGTKAQYDALATKNTNAIYFLTDTGEIRKGAAPFSHPVKAGALGALALTGVYDVEKDAVAVAAGDRLFWDDTRKLATPAAADGVFLGLAAANSPASAQRARVILNFGQSGVGGAGAPSGSDYEWQTI